VWWFCGRPAPVRQEDVREIYYSMEGPFAADLPAGAHYPLSEVDRDLILGIVGSARRRPLVSEYDMPTHGWKYPVYMTVTIELKDGSAYNLLLYNHKDWTIARGETEYKLALERIENGESRMWVLPYDECYAVKDRWAALLEDLRKA
jgi:hypothetical protein